MVNPGAFQGSRKEFLLSQKDTYSQAVEDGCAGDVLAQIQRKYFKRFPVDLPHDKEPTKEDLEAVDDEACDPELEEPNPDKMSAEEYKVAIDAINNRQKMVQFRKGQIKRWLSYQYMKDHDLDPKDSGALNPFRILLAKLTGKETNRPRLKPPVNVWRMTQRDPIEQILKRRAEAAGIGRAGYASLREKIAREMFNKLPEDEQRQWKQQAHEEHVEQMKAWKAEMNAPPSISAEDRQKAIMGLVRFIQPILDSVCDSTGWKATFIAGGPEPAHEGRLNVISMHSGTTPGDVQMHFGRAERLRYKKVILPIYGAFLQKCYTPDECRARALSKVDGCMSLESMDVEEDGNVTLDTIDLPTRSISALIAASLEKLPLPVSQEPAEVPIRQQSVPPSLSTPRTPARPRAYSLPPSSLPPTPYRSPVLHRAKDGPVSLASLPLVPLVAPAGVDSESAATASLTPLVNQNNGTAPAAASLSSPSGDLSSTTAGMEVPEKAETSRGDSDAPSGKKRKRKASAKAPAAASLSTPSEDPPSTVAETSAGDAPSGKKHKRKALVKAPAAVSLSTPSEDPPSTIAETSAGDAPSANKRKRKTLVKAPPVASLATLSEDPPLAVGRKRKLTTKAAAALENAPKPKRARTAINNRR